jgi:uncharacterized membrane protein
MIGVDAVYFLTGLMFAGVAILSARDVSNPKRWRNTLFWGLFAVSLLAGGRLGDFGNGCLVITMVLIAAFGGLGRGDARGEALEASKPREASAARWGDRLFIPALTIPVVTLFGALVLAKVTIGGHPVIDPKQTTPISLGLGVVAALIVAFAMLRPKPSEPLEEARRLIDSVGWAALLPQVLAALGVVFALAGVGKVIGGLATHWLPLDNRFAVVCAFTFGMALFTAIMGNAFAAFPVMAAAIGLPLIVKTFGGDAAVMGAIGMLSGFCGTLVTPMAANFNVVPAALLELKDRNAVIKAQAPTALILLIANTLLMYFLVFPGHR